MYNKDNFILTFKNDYFMYSKQASYLQSTLYMYTVVGCVYLISLYSSYSICYYMAKNRSPSTYTYAQKLRERQRKETYDNN